MTTTPKHEPSPDELPPKPANIFEAYGLPTPPPLFPDASEEVSELLEFKVGDKLQIKALAVVDDEDLAGASNIEIRNLSEDGQVYIEYDSSQGLHFRQPMALRRAIEIFEVDKSS